MKSYKSFTVMLALAAFMIVQLIATDSSQAGTIILQKLPGTTHSFTGLPLTEDGWTDFEAMLQNGYEDARVVFVSSSEGNDGTGQVYGIGAITFDVHGVFQNASGVNAYASLTAGYNQLRSGYPDILLLKRGDVWAEDFGSWSKSGRSGAERMILGSYGSASLPRPAITRFRSTNAVPLSHNIITSIELRANGPGLSHRTGGENLLIEDCLVSKGTNTGIIITGISHIDIPRRFDNAVVRRSAVVERYPTATTGHTQGIFGAGVDNFLIEESVFDHNGWTSNPEEGGGATIHNHNTYFDLSVVNPVMRYNISTRSSSKGFQPGGNGTLIANLSFRDPIGIETSRQDAGPDGFDTDVRQNVILEGWDSKTSSVTRWGILIQNASSSLVEDNIIASATPGAGGQSITFRTGVRSGQLMNARNVTIKDNIIHNWAGTLRLDDNRHNPAVPQLENIKLIGNRIHEGMGNGPLVLMSPANRELITESSGNVYHSGNAAPDRWFSYGGLMDLATWNSTVGDTTSVAGETNPTSGYTIPDYLTSIGETATLENFWAKIREQRRGSWDERFTAVPVINFVRDKFGRAPIDKVY